MAVGSCAGWLSPSAEQLQTHWGLITVCDLEGCGSCLRQPLLGTSASPPPPRWTHHICLPLVKESWKPDGRPEKCLLVQIIHWLVLSSLGWNLGLLVNAFRLWYDLINQAQTAYVSPCGSSRASSAVFLVDRNRRCQFCLGKWPSIYQRPANSQLWYLQATQGFVSASRG